KRAGSYRKSLMFKTCQAGELTKVSACGSAPDEPKKTVGEELRHRTNKIHTWVVGRRRQYR
ncbi:unnamed protein product, partial [Tetraodon nigroviridis]